MQVCTVALHLESYYKVDSRVREVAQGIQRARAESRFTLQFSDPKSGTVPLCLAIICILVHLHVYPKFHFLSEKKMIFASQMKYLKLDKNEGF